MRKSSCFHKHGKHKGVLEVAIMQNRARAQAAERRERERKANMFSTVEEAFQAEKKRKNRSEAV